MPLELIVFFFLIAFLYSSAGFGGGSSYLAILALYSFSFYQIRSTALLCNIVVVLGSVIIFHRKGMLNWKQALPMVAVSIPAAFLGGAIRIEPRFFFIMLGISLFIAAILLWMQPIVKIGHEPQKRTAWLGPGLGGGIGLLSGMVGIGGGIFLSPALHFMKWNTPKQIAATAAFYILVNSIAGILGQMTNPDFEIDWLLALTLMASVFIGGQLGVRLTTKRLSQRAVKRMTAVLIFLVSMRILFFS